MDRKKTPDFITVSQDEVSLVQEADRIEARLVKEAREREEEVQKKEGRPLKEPMLFYDVPRERAILQARDQLARKYQEEQGLETPPILLTPQLEAPYQELSAPYRPARFHVYTKGSNSALTPSELEDLLLQKVVLRRKGEVLFEWDHFHYRRLSDNDARGLISEVLRAELRSGNAPALIGGVLSLLQSDRRILAAEEANRQCFAVLNGTVDIATLQFCPSNSRIFQTQFRDTYWSGPQPCPVFQAFLNTISRGDPELYLRVLETVGFLLSPDHSAKRFALFQGVGNSGKSALGSLIQSFYMPSDVASLSVHQFGERFALSALADRSINISMDLPNGIFDSRSVAAIKQITGGDSLSIEAKNRQPYSDHIRCKLLFGTNHSIELRVRDEAFAQRILLVPFCFPVPEAQQDFDLLDKLKREKRGIIYCALAAYREVMRRNYQFTGEARFGFKLNDIQVPAQAIDKIPLFVDQCCELDPTAFTTTTELHQGFEIFCRQLGISSSLPDRSAFSRALRTHLAGQITAKKKRVNGTPLNGYEGIRLK